MKQIYEGKAKIVYQGSSADEVIIHFKDDATAGNGAKKASIQGKGVLNNQIATLLFTYLEQNGVATHLLETLSEREIRCRKVTVFPLEVIVRNRAAGSMVRNLGLTRGELFEAPTVEYSYKKDELGDPLLNDDHAVALRIATREELAYIRAAALKVNELLKARFEMIGITLVDFKLEYGKASDGNIYLVDELSPDNMRLWDQDEVSFDKDRFREDSGDLISGYQAIYRALKETN